MGHDSWLRYKLNGIITFSVLKYQPTKFPENLPKKPSFTPLLSDCKLPEHFCNGIVKNNVKHFPKNLKFQFSKNTTAENTFPKGESTHFPIFPQNLFLFIFKLLTRKIIHIFFPKKKIYLLFVSERVIK